MRVIFCDKCAAKQVLDLTLDKLKEAVLKNFLSGFSQWGDSVLRYKGRLWVQNIDDLTKQILSKTNYSGYSIHPGSKKMYRDLQRCICGMVWRRILRKFRLRILIVKKWSWASKCKRFISRYEHSYLEVRRFKYGLHSWFSSNPVETWFN